MRLLIVDDEDYTREGLVEEINWEDYEIDEIMQARDGNNALKIAKWFLPDIVLTDIRMPKKDGIEFATDLMNLNPDSCVIFMSGYMEIAYLKKAIDLSAVAFVEKPISIQKVTEAVIKAVQLVKEKNTQKKLSVDNMELQKQKLVNLLICKDNSKELVHRLCLEGEFPIDSNYNCMVLEEREIQKNQDTNLKNIDSWLKKYNLNCLCNYKEQNQYVIILSYHRKKNKSIDALYRSFSKAHPQFNMGIGFPVADILKIYSSYSTALTALNYSFYDKNTKLFEIDEHMMRQTTIEPGVYNEFLNIYKNMPYQLGDWFHQLVEKFVDLKYYEKNQVKNLFQSFIITILKDHVDLYEGLNDISSLKDVEIAFEYANTIFDIDSLLHDVANQFTKKLDSISRYSKIVNDITDYILKNYQNPNLSIQEIAEYMCLSATHLNVLFKQEKKITLKQYLSNLRNDKAKEILLKEHDTITEVAQKCGYTNANYFAKVFKESNHCTPLEYRKKCTI